MEALVQSLKRNHIGSVLKKHPKPKVKHLLINIVNSEIENVNPLQFLHHHPT